MPADCMAPKGPITEGERIIFSIIVGFSVVAFGAFLSELSGEVVDGFNWSEEDRFYELRDREIESLTPEQQYMCTEDLVERYKIENGCASKADIAVHNVKTAVLFVMLAIAIVAGRLSYNASPKVEDKKEEEAVSSSVRPH